MASGLGTRDARVVAASLHDGAIVAASAPAMNAALVGEDLVCIPPGFGGSLLHCGGRSLGFKDARGCRGMHDVGVR